MDKAPSTSFADTKPHYPILDGLRGIAALVVVWYHIFEAFATSRLDQIINHGYLAVDFFFMLSGFVLAYAYDDRWGKMSAGAFLKRRLIRLHPMVLFGAVLGAALFYTQGCDAWDVSKVSLGMLLVGLGLNLLLIPAPSAYEVRGLGEMYPLNGPSWSLFFEYLGNLLYAFVLRRLPLASLKVIVLLSGLGLLSIAVWGSQGDLCVGWAVTSEQIVGGSLRLIFAMTMGLVLCRSFRPRSSQHSLYWGGGVLILLAVLPRIGGTEFFWLNGLYNTLAVVLAFPLIIYFAASEQIASPRLRQVCSTLGELSYPLYLVHYPFLYCYYAWVKNHELSFVDSLPGALALFFGSIALAWLVLRLYDAPLRQWLAKHWLSR
nr:acyltransferase [uncultured Porphyromonas sp.]